MEFLHLLEDETTRLGLIHLFSYKSPCTDSFTTFHEIDNLPADVYRKLEGVQPNLLVFIVMEVSPRISACCLFFSELVPQLSFVTSML